MFRKLFSVCGKVNCKFCQCLWCRLVNRDTACTLFMPCLLCGITTTAFCRVSLLVSFFVLLAVVQWQLIARELATVVKFEPLLLSAVTRKTAINIMLVHQLDLNSIVIHPNTAVTAHYCCSYRDQW